MKENRPFILCIIMMIIGLVLMTNAAYPRHLIVILTDVNTLCLMLGCFILGLGLGYGVNNSRKKSEVWLNRLGIYIMVTSVIIMAAYIILCLLFKVEDAFYFVRMDTFSLGSFWSSSSLWIILPMGSVGIGLGMGLSIQSK